jgi:hypothetical protein
MTTNDQEWYQTERRSSGGKKRNYILQLHTPEKRLATGLPMGVLFYIGTFLPAERSVGIFSFCLSRYYIILGKIQMLNILTKEKSNRTARATRRKTVGGAVPAAIKKRIKRRHRGAV